MMTQRNVRAVYVGDADNGTESEVCARRFQLAYLSPEQRISFKQAARATRMTHDSDVIDIAYHAGTKTWHELPDLFSHPPPPFSSAHGKIRLTCEASDGHQCCRRVSHARRILTGVVQV